MTFIITLISLLIERFFDWNHIRHWRWFTRFQNWLCVKVSAWPTNLILAISLALPVIAVALINNTLTGVLFGLLKLVFGIAVVVYCLGPTNFWAQFYVYSASLDKDKPQDNVENASALFGVPASTDPQAFHRAFTSALFIEANRRVFAVLFWYMILGPAGALLYRLTDVSYRKTATVSQPAEKFKRILDWLPVRILSFLFAIGGHFTPVIKRWKQQAFDTPAVNEVLLADCGIVALDLSKDNLLPEDGTAEQEAVALLDRVFVITLVLLAVIVLV
jgi:membrane protein required for beta-lactamase induction